jgi:hypothetical protein
MSDSQQGEVLKLLLGAAEASEEECRAVVAECLGSLALLNAALVLPALQSQLKSASGGWRVWGGVLGCVLGCGLGGRAGLLVHAAR